MGFSRHGKPPELIESNQAKKIFDRNHYRQPPSTRSELNNTKGFSAPPPPKAPVELPTIILSTELNPISPSLANAVKPAWLDDEDVFLTTEPSPIQLARANLFPTLTHRGILSTALRVKKPGKEADIPRLIKQVIKGQIPKDIPTIDSISLERGCQLLLDFSDSMVPFWEDLTALASQVQNLLGTERVKVYEFDQDPANGKHWGPRGISKDWQADVTRPILVATDLGISGQRIKWPVTQAWRHFIQQCTEKNMPLIVLVPWQETYWPEQIGNHPVLIHWNPHTTATMIKKLVGTGHRVEQ